MHLPYLLLPRGYYEEQCNHARKSFNPVYKQQSLWTSHTMYLQNDFTQYSEILCLLVHHLPINLWKCRPKVMVMEGKDCWDTDTWSEWCSFLGQSCSALLSIALIAISWGTKEVNLSPQPRLAGKNLYSSSFLHACNSAFHCNFCVGTACLIQWHYTRQKKKSFCFIVTFIRFVISESKWKLNFVGIRTTAVCKGRQNPLQPCSVLPTLDEIEYTSHLLRDLMQQDNQLIPVTLMSCKKISSRKNSLASHSEERLP